MKKEKSFSRFGTICIKFGNLAIYMSANEGG